MNKILFRPVHDWATDNPEFIETTLYIEIPEVGIGVVKIDDNKFPYVFVDIPTGCRIGRSFKTFEDIKRFVNYDTMFNTYIDTILKLRHDSNTYKRLLEQRLEYSATKKKEDLWTLTRK